MSKILVVDDMAFCREPIAEALRVKGYEALCAASGQEALTMARDQRPDLVLLDMNMPGMDGLATLSAIRGQAELKTTPVLLLTDRSDREGIVEACRRGVQGYILKSTFSLNELFARIDKCLSGPAPAATQRPVLPAGNQPSPTKAALSNGPKSSPASHQSPVAGAVKAPVTAAHDPTGKPPSNLTGAKLLAQICKHLEVKPLGATVQNVIAVSSSATCSVQDVTRAVGPDQALCIRLLRVANSSAYRRGHPVSDVRSAVQRVGIQEVRNLVMTLDVFESYASTAGSQIDPRLFWEHSIACGLIAADIAKARNVRAADAYFLWGVLHDVGRLIMLSHLSDRYAALWDDAHKTGQPLENVERQSLQLDHCEVLDKALENWKFSRDFIVPVVSHHWSIERLRHLGGEHREAAATIALANRIAHAMLLGDSGDETLHPFGELADLLQLRPSAIPQIVSVVPGETNDLKVAMLSRSDGGPWPGFKEKTQARLTRPVRALCVSHCQETDAYRLFFDTIAPTPAGTLPNLGVIYFSDQDNQAELITRFEEAEQMAGGKNIPVVVIHSKKDIVDDARLCKRKCRVLSTVVSISTILATIEELVAVEGEH